MVSTGKGPKCPRGGSRHRDSGKMGEQGLRCREGPQEVCACVPHQFWGCPHTYWLWALWTACTTDRCWAHVDKDGTGVPAGIQEADCFLSSLPLHVGGERAGGRAVEPVDLGSSRVWRRLSAPATCSRL